MLEIPMLPVNAASQQVRLETCDIKTFKGIRDKQLS